MKKKNYNNIILVKYASNFEHATAESELIVGQQPRDNFNEFPAEEVVHLLLQLITSIATHCRIYSFTQEIKLISFGSAHRFILIKKTN